MFLIVSNTLKLSPPKKRVEDSKLIENKHENNTWSLILWKEG